MNKLSLLLNSGKNEIYLDGFIRIKPNTRMKVKNAAVYWNFKNVTKNFNDTVTLTDIPKDVTLKEGYWSFHMLAEKLAENDVKLERNRYDNTCKIFPKNSNLRLKNLGPMLGFSKNATVRSNTWTTSTSNVDVNLGYHRTKFKFFCSSLSRFYKRSGSSKR